MTQASRSEARQQSRPGQQLQPENKALRYDDPGSAAAEEGLIRLLYLEPSLAQNAALPQPEEFSSQALAHIYSVLREKILQGAAVSVATLGGAFDQQEMSLLVNLLQKPELLSKGESTLTDYIKRIRDCKEQAMQGADLRALADKLRQTKGYEG